MSAVMKEIEGLTIEEKLELVGDIWDQISRDSDHLPIPEWQREELERREQDTRDNPEAEDDWGVVRKRLRAKL